MKVVLRADASSASGIGHLMRSFAIGQALRETGVQVELVTAVEPGSLRQMWDREDIRMRVIDADPGSTLDARQTRKLAAGADWLVLDGYDFGCGYNAAVRGDGRLLLMDDHGARGVDADLVVNGNLYARRDMYLGSHARLLLGPTFAPLRREIRTITRSRWPRGVVVSLGGADPDSRTAPLLSEMTARGIRGRVVIGPKHPEPEQTRATASVLGWDAVEGSSELPALLAAAKFVVIGAGTTTLECAAIGVPMVAVRIAENQGPVADALAREGLALVAEGDDPGAIADCAGRLATDAKRRAEMSRRGTRLVDGRGALRIASAMSNMQPLSLREVTVSDARLLYDWHNDPQTRAVSFGSARVPWNGHVTWLDRALRSPEVSMRIAELGDIAIGVVRLERADLRVTISVTVAPTSRGQNLAVPLIWAGVDLARGLGVQAVDAFIRPENLASRRAFASAGFVEVVCADSTSGTSRVRMVADLIRGDNR